MIKKPLPNYLNVFRSRLKELRKLIERELKKKKTDRNRKQLRKIVREARELNRAIREATLANVKRCPHCNGALEEELDV